MGAKLPKNDKRIDAATLNESLLAGIVRQHELTETAELLVSQLQEEIEARIKAEEALIQGEKLAYAGRMSAALAHEINNPLESITNLLYLTQSLSGLPEEARHYLALADAELRRVAHIARQTLGFYRDASAPTTFSAKSLLDSVFDLLQAKRVSMRATVERQCEEGLTITMFQGELRQVLSNLLMNALDAVGDGGRVTLKASRSFNPEDGSRPLRFTVSDNGRGIKRETLSQLFKPFFTTKGSVGNGLGLWVSRQIIEKHGGSIRIRSCTEGLRKGTTFSVIVPDIAPALPTSN